MKRAVFILMAALALSAIGQAMPVRSYAVEDFDAAALPRDKASLEKLNDEQLRLLRRSVRYCGDFGSTRHSGNFCVTSNTDLDVRQNGSPAMKAFHWTLNPLDRYDDARSMVAVSRLVKE